MSGDEEEDVVMDVLVAESSLEDEVEKALEKITETRLSSVSESAASESTSTTHGFVTESTSVVTSATAVTTASAVGDMSSWEAFDDELAIVEAKVAGVEDELSSNLAQTIDLTKDDDENISELNHKVSSVQMSLAKLVEQSEKMMNVDDNDGDGKTKPAEKKKTDQRAEAVEALQVGTRPGLI